MSRKRRVRLQINAGRTDDGRCFLEVEHSDRQAVYAVAVRAMPILQREPSCGPEVEVSPEGSPLTYVRWYFADAAGRNRAAAAVMAEISPGTRLPFEAAPLT